MIMDRLTILFLCLISVSLLSETVAQQTNTDVIVFPAVGFAKLQEDGKLHIQSAQGGFAVPYQERVEQNYTVMVPYTEETKDKDGKQRKVTKTRAETRTRTINVTRMLKLKDSSFPLDKCEFRLASGDDMSAIEIEDDFRERTAVLILFGEEKLHDTIKDMLKPNTIVINCPKIEPPKKRAGKRR